MRDIFPGYHSGRYNSKQEKNNNKIIIIFVVVLVLLLRHILDSNFLYRFWSVFLKKKKVYLSPVNGKCNNMNGKCNNKQIITYSFTLMTAKVHSVSVLR